MIETSGEGTAWIMPLGAAPDDDPAATSDDVPGEDWSWVDRKVISESGEPQVWLAHYSRYHQPDWDEANSPEEAQAFLRAMMEAGEISACCIVWPDGRRRTYDYVHNRLGDFQPRDDQHCPRRAVTEG